MKLVEPGLPLILAGGAMLAVLGASAATWLAIGWRLQRGEDLIPFEPRRPVPWTGWHAVSLLAVFILLQVGAGRATLEWVRNGQQHVSAGKTDGHEQAQSDGPGEAAADGDTEQHEETEKHLDTAEMEAILLANAAVNAVVGLGAVIVLRFGRAGASWADLGLSPARLAYDVRTGVLAFFAISVPVYALNALIGLLVKGEHPIIVFVREARTTSSLLVAGFAAVVLAPFVEELLFRVILQGWLESTHLPAAEQDTASPTRMPIAWPPIVISAGVFAVLHANHGPAPIPLFVLAVVLGVLYQRTHRMWPSATVHFLINLISILALWFAISQGL